LNGKRRLAFFTATNIDGSLAKDVDRATGVVTDAAGPDPDDEAAEEAEAAERWFADPRVEDEEQTPPEFYEGQTTFDAAGRPITNRQSGDHRNRMFQQGHLTRRQDPLWGPDDVVVRAHADTFHVTNRAPQVGYFNMGTRKRGPEAAHPGGTLHWRALEDYVLQNARADRARVSVFTGPIFDERRDFAWSRGRADMRGFKAPRAYWKLVLRVEGGALRATALLADQSPLIDFLPELLDVGDQEASRISFDKVEKYQLSVAELQRRTGLKFGANVVSADTFVAGGGGESARKRVEDVEDLALGYGKARPRKPRLRGRRPPARRKR
jgi:endonuclease G